MARVLLVCTSGTTPSAEEVGLRDTLVAKGHAVTYRGSGSGDPPPAGLLNDYDLVWIHAAVGSAGDGRYAAYTQQAIPLVCGNRALACNFGTTSSSASGTTLVTHTGGVADSHPLNAGLVSPTTIYDISPGSINFCPDLAPAFQLVWLRSTTNNNRAVIAGLEAGQLMADGVTAAPARRVWHSLRYQEQGRWEVGELTEATVQWATTGTGPPPDPGYQFAVPAEVLANTGGWLDHDGADVALVSALTDEADETYIHGLGVIEYKLSSILTAQGRIKRLRACKHQPGGNAVNLLVEVRDPAGTTVLSTHLIALTDNLTSYSVPVNASTYSGECRLRFTATQA
jgi:hypothetical protein